MEFTDEEIKVILSGLRWYSSAVRDDPPPEIDSVKRKFTRPGYCEYCGIDLAENAPGAKWCKCGMLLEQPGP